MSKSKDPELDPDYDNCLRCGTRLESVGYENFRVGGSSGGWTVVFGPLAHLGEDTIDFDVFACPDCRKVEFRVPRA